MKLSPHSRKMAKTASAFTLIELLVVISIIAILAGLGFGGIQAAIQSAKKSQAKNDIFQIVTAVKAFAVEYGRNPIPSADAPAGKDVVYGSASSGKGNEQVLNILTASEGASAADIVNPRQVKYLQVNAAKNQTVPVSGLNTTKQWVDPWGAQYVIFLDGDYDSSTSVSTVYKDVGLNNNPPGTVVGSVAAASFGKDKMAGSNGSGKFANSDDVVTW